ncbi:hypothetical protein KC318_g20250, partial [Hortaea werneckii]
MTLRNKRSKEGTGQHDGGGQQQQQQQQQPSYPQPQYQQQQRPTQPPEGRQGSAESSGAESWRSNSTVRGPLGGSLGGGGGGGSSGVGGRNGSLKEGRGTAVTVNTENTKNNKRLQLDRKDSEVSPGTVVAGKQAPASNARGTIAPWEQDDAPSPGSQPSEFRNDFTIHHGQGNAPSINRHPPSASLQSDGRSSGNERPMPNSIFSSSFYDDSNENLGQVSPGYPPPNGMGFPGDHDDRRPSIASATTVSSTGSKSSLGNKYKKKLHGFFGEDPYNNGQQDNGSTSRHNSEASSMKGGILPSFAPGGSRARNNSMNDALGRSGPPSPSSSRPRTPVAPGPSSEVTPWIFQDQDRNASETQIAEQSNGRPSRSHRLHLPGHRHNRSTEEK